MRRVLLLAPCLAASCAAPLTVDRSASLGSPAEARLEEVPICGYPATATGPGVEVRGELVAADATGLWLAAGGDLVHLAPGQADRVMVEVLPDTRTGTTLATILGSASTLSHGVFLVFTLPAWLSAGAAAVVTSGRLHAVDARAGDIRLSEFARFPQGKPTAWPAAEGSRTPPCQARPWSSGDRAPSTPAAPPKP